MGPGERVFHNKMTGTLWQRGCDRLAAELPEQQFNTWIRPLPAADVTEQGELGTVVSLRACPTASSSTGSATSTPDASSVLSELAGRPVRLDLMLEQRETAATGPYGAVPRQTNGSAHPVPGAARPASRRARTPRPALPGTASTRR